MSKKDCTTCGYAQWQTTAGGKRRLEKPGECTFPPIDLPHCYGDLRGNMPERDAISKWTKPDCPCWKKIEVKS